MRLQGAISSLVCSQCSSWVLQPAWACIAQPAWACMQQAAQHTSAMHHHPPRRAMLYVPGSMEKKIRKAAGEVGADSIIMDCEDGVAANMKEQARQTIALMLDDLDFGPSEAAVRINPVSSGLAEEDLQAVLSAKRLPDALVVPKVESPDEVHWVLDRVQRLIASGRQRSLVCDSSSGSSGNGGGSSSGSGSSGTGGSSSSSSGSSSSGSSNSSSSGSSNSSSSGVQPWQQQWRRPMAFIPMCESALALLNLRQTFEAAKAHPAASVLQLQACILGGDDMAASLGATRTHSNSELAHARGLFLLTCRALQVQAIDIVKIDLSEAGVRALLEEAKSAALEGWSGKQVIHPKQVKVVQAALSPSKADVEAAIRLVAAFKDHQEQGHGAFVFEGKMIDAPTVLQARNVLALAERLEHMN